MKIVNLFPPQSDVLSLRISATTEIEGAQVNFKIKNIFDVLKTFKFVASISMHVHNARARTLSSLAGNERTFKFFVAGVLEVEVFNQADVFAYSYFRKLLLRVVSAPWGANNHGEEHIDIHFIKDFKLIRQ